MKTVTFTKARQNFSAVMNETYDDRIPIMITRGKGRPCILMSLDDYESLEETAWLLRSPANVRHLKDSISELQAGKEMVKNLIDVEDKHQERGR
jgi:antitoxin YefM